MITEDERHTREQFYYDSHRHLTHIHGKPPTIQEMVLYMSLILKEDPIELAIAIYKLEQGRIQNERNENFDINITTMGPAGDAIQEGDQREEEGVHIPF